MTAGSPRKAAHLGGALEVPRGGHWWVRGLEMHDVRNLSRVAMTLPQAGIAVIGDNGQGKTNFLEALAYLHVLRSVRGASDSEMTRFGAPGFYLRAEAILGGLLDDTRHVRHLAVGYERSTKRKRVVLDGGDPVRLSDALGAVPSVTFSPVDVELVRGAPSERRRYLDVVLATTSRSYLAALQTYRQTLLRRNATLRSGARANAVAAWEPMLADAGAIVWAERMAWTDRWNGELARACTAIGESGEVIMRYTRARRAREEKKDDTREQIAGREWLERALAEGRDEDMRRGTTRVGPHRDDLAFTLDGRSAQTFASAGQQRTIAIVLRLLEAETLRAHVGGTPVLLFDDPFAELDEARARAVLDVLHRGGLVVRDAGDGSLAQVIIAVPRESDIPEAFTGLDRWWMAGGVLKA